MAPGGVPEATPSPFWHKIEFGAISKGEVEAILAAPGRKRQFFGTPKIASSGPEPPQKKSMVPDRFWKPPNIEAEDRAGNGAVNKIVLELILVTFCYMFKAFLGRQRTLARDPKILQKMHSP